MVYRHIPFPVCGSPLKAIIISTEDAASVNIGRHLEELARWEPYGEFSGKPVRRRGEYILVTIDRIHLEYDLLDKDIADALKVKLSTMIYASRHRSQSGMRSLTVHPLGNHGPADFGGKPENFVPAAPGPMTNALRLLARKARELEYSVSFEATHHGPYLETPTFFIEIGSDEDAWQEPGPGRAIAETLLALGSEPDYPVAIGVGGGHYSPRMTEVALSRGVSFGHILSNYALKEDEERVVAESCRKTPDAKLVYFHRKGLKKSQIRRLKEYFETLGVMPVSSNDLEVLEPDKEYLPGVHYEVDTL